MTADELFSLLLLIAIVSGVLMVSAIVADAIERYRSRQALDRANAKFDRLNMGGRHDRRKMRVIK